jgi:hypothetical protein
MFEQAVRMRSAANIETRLEKVQSGLSNHQVGKWRSRRVRISIPANLGDK